MQVKLFWVQAPMKDEGFVSRDKAGNANAFEQKINEWLAQSPGIEIHHIKQSVCGGSFGPALWLVSVWYDSDNS